MTTKCDYSEAFDYDRRLKEFYTHSGSVADEVAKRFLRPGYSAFISDGTSTLAVALSVFSNAESRALTISTTNLALAHEFPLWRKEKVLYDINVRVASGAIDADLFLIHGRSAMRFASNAAAELEWSILSVAGLFGSHGPAGKEHASMSIKRAAALAARRIVWVADYKKLSTSYAHEPLVYNDEAHWNEACNRKNMWIVTSCHPEALPGEKKSPHTYKAVQHSVDHYRVNRNALREMVGWDRFIEVKAGS